MKPIEKHNIFELIGKDRRKYHSALVTCYSYDFSFFEERLLTVLRIANVKNVNVFVDGRYLEHLLEHTTGKEFRQNKSYTITPVYPKGVFHPKLMLLIGPKQGLLIVGSGNLTGAGICSNDEIWGAFHLSVGECEHVSLFADAWEYFSYLKKDCKGFVHQTFEWIKRYAPWVNTLRVEKKWCIVKKQEQISFLYNQPRNGILNQLASLIPKKNLESLTVVSPFYDSGGKLLTDLKTIFRPGIIHAVIHTELGSIPENINTTGLNIHFYEWEKVMQNASRLHAKIFHFKFSSDDQYLLFGSANASGAAFGTLGNGATNEEVSLLLFRNSKTSYLQELGINIPRKSISLADIEAIKVPNAIKDLNFKYRVTYVELEGRKMTIHFDQCITGSLTVAVLDTYGDIIEELGLAAEGNETSFTITDTDNCFKIAIVEGEERVSNYQLIHRVEQLIKNNPDPKQEKLDTYIEEFLSGQRDDIAELFNHLSYNWADEDDQPSHKAAVITTTVKSNPVNGSGDYKKLDEKQFNEISKDVLLRQSGILTSSNIKIAEFLGTLASNLASASKEEFDESEETKQLQQGGGGEGDQVKSKRRLKTNGEREQRAIFNFYWKLYNLFDEMLEPYYISNGMDTPKSPVTIKGLSNMLIALDVFQLYYGRKFQVEQETNDGGKSYAEVEYIQEGSITGWENAVWFLVDVLGKFLILTLAGHKTYEYELLQNKQKEMRWNIFMKGLFAICNITWNERTACYRDTLLLNSLMMINPEDPSDPAFNGKVRKQLDAFKNKSHKIHPNYNGNVDYFFASLVPKFLRWLSSYSDSAEKPKLIKALTDLKPNSIIYKKSSGFAQFVKFRRGDKHNQLTLIASGYDWDEDEGYCMLKDHPNGAQVILFG